MAKCKKICFFLLQLYKNHRIMIVILTAWIAPRHNFAITFTLGPHNNTCRPEECHTIEIGILMIVEPLPTVTQDLTRYVPFTFFYRFLEYFINVIIHLSIPTTLAKSFKSFIHLIRPNNIIF